MAVIRSMMQEGETTVTSTGTQNDVATGDAITLRLNNATDLTITGFAAGVAGQRLTLVAVGAGNVYLKHQNTGSSASNRLINFATSGDTPLKGGVGYATYRYDATTARWRLCEHDQGGYISVPFASASYDSDTGAFWTVDSGDVAVQRFYMKGKKLTWNVTLVTTTTSAGVGSRLRIDFSGFQPWTWDGTSRQWCRVNQNGTITTGMVTAADATSRIQFSPQVTDPAWSTLTNLVTIDGSLIEVVVN